LIFQKLYDNIVLSDKLERVVYTIIERQALVLTKAEERNECTIIR
jgi:hypothetical protein